MKRIGVFCGSNKDARPKYEAAAQAVFYSGMMKFFGPRHARRVQPAPAP
jgi:hypothetical protein